MERPLFPDISYLKQKYGDIMAELETAQKTISQSIQHKSDSGPIEDSDQMIEKNVNNQATASKASRILRMALTAASKINEKEKQSDTFMNALLVDLVKSFDIRSCVFASFFRVGFDLHELNAVEKQQMEIIQLYPYLKNGEIWKDIKQELDDINLKPTSDDKHWMDSAIEGSFEQAEQAVVN